jgi:hypothetical protein
MKTTTLFIAVLMAFALCLPTANAVTPAEIQASIDDGLAWLAGQQNPNGSWGYSAGETGLAVKKFEHYAITMDPPVNPLNTTYQYYAQVRGGLDFLFSQAIIVSIGVQPAGDPDSDGDGIGVCFVSDDWHRTYETGIALMAIAESDCRDSIVDVPGSPIDGWTFYDVAVDAVDYLAWAQIDAGDGRGGWCYTDASAFFCDWSDNSNAGYATLGLAYAAAAPPDGFQIPIPPFVKDELNIWIDFIQNSSGGTDDGGSGYSVPWDWVNCLKTGNLLFQMALVGDFASPRLDRAVDYLVRHWYDANPDPGWQNHYQAMYAIMKGAEFQGKNLLGPIDWYTDFADAIVASQHPDGSWGPDYWGGYELATAWALLTLERAAPPSEDQCALFTIETEHALNGQNVSVSITLENNELEMGGFDFLIAFDNSALAFMEATPGQLLEDCGWEYFTYRHGVEGNCGDACPSGLLRIIAIADLDNGSGLHPACFGPPDTDPHELAEMKFTVTRDRNFIHQCLPIYFFWDDCGDNTVASISGDTTYLDQTIYGFTGNLLWDEDDDDEFPDDARPQGLGAPDACLEGGGPDKPLPLRFLCFQHGAICVDEPPDDRGDINLNGIANEVGDAVLFSTYFIYGDVVWDPVYRDVQILATDVNDDGIVLTVADLVYLIRIITGDEQAFPPGENPKLAPQATASIGWQVTDGSLNVEWNCDRDAGAVLLAFDHDGAEFGAPVLADHTSGMKLISHNTGSQLRVLIYGMDKGVRIPAGEGRILSVPVRHGGDGLTIAEVEAAGYYGSPIQVDLAKSATVPRQFALLQNSPNPFNASTQITFVLPDAGDVTLAVYDVGGRRVATIAEGHMEPGTHHISWDARDADGNDLASGVYFYRIITPTHTASKKMVLLK